MCLSHVCLQCVVQVVMCRRPEELLMVTFNHLDGMRKYVGGSPEHVHIINSIHKRTREVRQALEGEGEDSKRCAPPVASDWRGTPEVSR